MDFVTQVGTDNDDRVEMMELEYLKNSETLRLEGMMQEMSRMERMVIFSNCLSGELRMDLKQIYLIIYFRKIKSSIMTLLLREAFKKK